MIGLEDTFEVDLNGDGVMGYSPITLETNGDHKLLTIGNQYYIEDTSQNQIGLTSSEVGAVGPDTFSGYSATQAEDDGAGGFNVLWSHTSGKHLLWQVDSAGYYQSGDRVAPADWIGLEDTFEVDINGDGTISLLSSNLSGGMGDELFVFQNSGGNYTITDFTAGAGSDDRIDISAFGFGTFADVQAAADLGADVTIQLDADDSVILLGVQAADLHSDDFII